MIDLAVQYGHESLEAYSMFEFQPPDLEKAKRVREYADSKNIKFCCLSVYADFSKEDYAVAVSRLKSYAKIAQIIGSPYLHHTVIAEVRNPSKILSERDQYFDLGIRAIREVYDYAQTLGVRTVLEDQGYVFNGVKGMGELLRKVDRQIGLVADFGNIAQAGDDVTDFIKAFPDKIVHVHIKDIKITNEPISEGSLATMDHKYMTAVKLGCGDVRLKEACSLLKEIGYDGYLSAEFAAMDENSDTMKESFDLIRKYL